MARFCKSRSRLENRSLLWVALTIILTLHPAAARSAGLTLVRPEPARVMVAVGAIAEVSLFVEDVANLYGADIRLTFDPAMLEVVDADAALPGVQIAPIGTFLKPEFVVKRKACNVSNSRILIARSVGWSGTPRPKSTHPRR